jgi:hypothetical protein
MCQTREVLSLSLSLSYFSHLFFSLACFSCSKQAVKETVDDPFDKKVVSILTLKSQTPKEIISMKIAAIADHSSL